QLFEKDTPRFFVGEVEDYESGMVKVKGFTFVKDFFRKKIKKKIELRTKIFSMLSGTFLVYQLPSPLRLDSVTFHHDETGGLMLTDDGGFSMDVSESGSKHEAHS
ncbi:MAG: hypothetical protein KC643_04205, partial [Nitrospira sp.]|nr:hypothetical protein [Nitrospira sp.]